ncbi:MAG: hypothetical protein RL368_2344 [Pseudomonadota bacterium]|jgi:hypothetical protein
MARNLLIIAWLCIVTNYAYGADVVKQTIDAYGVKIVVINTDDGHVDKLFVNNKEIDEDAFIEIKSIKPTPEDVLAAYIVSSDAGGSGTMPGYSLLTVSKEKQVSFFYAGYGEPKSIHSDGKSIVMKFPALHNRFDHSMTEPAQTVTYSKGKITTKKGKMK